MTLFRNPDVRTIILSRVLLQLGIWVQNFAVLLFVSEWTNNNPVYVSLISVEEFAPIFLFGLIGGTFADRWQPKRTMVWSDLLSALSVGAVLLVLMNDGWIARPQHGRRLDRPRIGHDHACFHGDDGHRYVRVRLSQRDVLPWRGLCRKRRIHFRRCGSAAPPRRGEEAQGRESHHITTIRRKRK